MCLITFAYKVHRDYDLVLVANRDEYYQRKSTAMHWWLDPAQFEDEGLLAGRDEEAGGTWFGVTRSGSWAALTNFREPNGDRGDARTRGELVTKFLQERVSSSEFAESLNVTHRDYNGFNLLVADGQGVVWATNRTDSAKLRIESLSPGIYGLSNHLLNTGWPKVELAKSNLTAEINKESLHPKSLTDVLLDDSRPNDDQLPDTGVGLEKERILSSMFIANDELRYGTRCTTAMMIAKDGTVSVAEKSYPGGTLVEYSFRKKV